MMIIAHRGASGSAPENTLAAFRRAMRDGANWLELDVCASRDQRIIVVHDDTVDRTTNGFGRICDFTHAELKRLDAGSFFHRRFTREKIPVLEEVIRLVQPTRVGLCIEMKPGPHLSRGFEERLVAVLRKGRMLNRTHVMSFNHAAVGRVKRLEPKVKTLLLIDRFVATDRLVARVRKHRADGVSLHAPLATPGLVRRLHSNQMIVVVWTVNSVSTMSRYLAVGVDGITTNFPRRLANLIRRGGNGPRYCR